MWGKSVISIPRVEITGIGTQTDFALQERLGFDELYFFLFHTSQQRGIFFNDQRGALCSACSSAWIDVYVNEKFFYF